MFISFFFYWLGDSKPPFIDFLVLIFGDLERLLMACRYMGCPTLLGLAYLSLLVYSYSSSLLPIMAGGLSFLDSYGRYPSASPLGLMPFLRFSTMACERSEICGLKEY